MLLIVVTPLQTKAVSEVVLGIYFIAASVCAYLGVEVATADIDWKATFDTLLDNLQTNYSYVYDYWYDQGEKMQSAWESGYKTIISFTGDMWSDIVNCVYDTYSSYDASSYATLSTVHINTSGIYGFTSDSANQLKFSVPELVNGSYSSLITDTYRITYYDNYSATRFSSDIDASKKTFTGFSLYFDSNSIELCPGAYFSVNPSPHMNSFDAICSNYSIRYSSCICNLDTGYIVGTCNGDYVKVTSDSNGYYILNLTTNTAISLSCKDETRIYFPSTISIFEFLFESVGLAHENVSGLFGVSNPSTDTTFEDLSSDVVINSDYFPTSDDLTKTYDDVDVVVSSDVSDITADSVRDIAADDIYPSEVPAISTPATLFDKFPFCLPNDLYNLVACFWNGDINDKAPYFEIPVKWEQWGIDETLVLDFSAFDYLIDLFRFFVGFGWVAVLIVLTRKLIGS